MSEAPVQFENEAVSTYSSASVGSTGITKWLIANTGGFVKTEKQAQQFLLGIAILLILFAGWLLVSGSKGVEKLDENDVQRIIQNQQGATAPSR